MNKKKTLRAIASGTMISSLVLSAMATPIMAKEGWNAVNGKWTYESNGVKQTGWSKIGNSWFGFDKNGDMLTGWVASGDFWYWLSPGSGVMQDNGWITDSNNQAFFIEPNGVMASDTVKDGYEIKADGTRILLSESNSVVLGTEGLAEGTIIEGNLYVSAEAAKDLVLKGITVKGKLVIEGGQNITITDSAITEMKLNQADANVILTGKTVIKDVELTKQATLSGDKNYKGEIETIIVTSLVKQEATIAVPANTVTSKSWAPVSVEENVKNLVIMNETEVKIAKGVTVDKVEANAPTRITGEGKVTNLEANNPDVKADVKVDKVTGENKDNVTNTEGGVVEKPSTGGGSSGGGGSVTPPTPDKTVANVANLVDFKAALADNKITTINLANDIKNITETIKIDHKVVIDGKGKSLTFTDAVNEKSNGERNGLLVMSEDVEIKDVKVVMTADQKWTGAYAIQVYDSTNVTLSNVSTSQADGGILVNGSKVALTGTIDVSGNESGGIEVSKGTDLINNSELIISGAAIINGNETMSTPTIWVIEEQGKLVGAEKLTKKVMDKKTYYFLKDMSMVNVSTEEELTKALADSTVKTIQLTANIEGINATIKIERAVTIDGKGKSLTFTNAVNDKTNGERNGLLVMSEDVEIKDVQVVMTADQKWTGAYAIQVYDSTNVTLSNVSTSQADGGILVNGSKVTLTGTIDVSGNEFGGIEVSKGEDLENNAELNITNADITNTSESTKAPTIWLINGQGSVIGKTLVSKVVDGKTYYFIHDQSSALVDSLNSFKEALSDTAIETIKLTADITDITETLNVDRKVTIDGQTHLLTFTEDLNKKDNGKRNGLLITAEATVKNLTVIMSNVEYWQGIYGIQVYNTTGANLSNVTTSNADGGILINGSTVALEGNIDVSGNEFGGIEVSKGEGLENNAELNIKNASFTNDAESVENPTIWVINGQGGVVGKKLPSKVVGSKTYYFTTDQSVVTVGTLEAFKNAVADSEISTIQLSESISDISETLVINRPVTIDGNGLALSFTKDLNEKEAGNRNGLLIIAKDVVVKNLNVVLANENGWQGIYGIQVYNATGVTLSDVTTSNADGGILVNSSEVTLTYNIDVSGNEFGGIEISKGKDGIINPSLDIKGAYLKNDSEKYGQPTVWMDGVDATNATFTGELLFEATDVKEGQTQFYISKDNTRPRPEGDFAPKNIRVDADENRQFVLNWDDAIDERVVWYKIEFRNGEKIISDGGTPFSFFDLNLFLWNRGADFFKIDNVKITAQDKDDYSLGETVAEFNLEITKDPALIPVNSVLKEVGTEGKFNYYIDSANLKNYDETIGFVDVIFSIGEKSPWSSGKGKGYEDAIQDGYYVVKDILVDADSVEIYIDSKIEVDGDGHYSFSRKVSGPIPVTSKTKMNENI